MKVIINVVRSAMLQLSQKQHAKVAAVILVVVIWTMHHMQSAINHYPNALVEFGIPLTPLQHPDIIVSHPDIIASLVKLTRSHSNETCPSSLVHVNDTILDDPALAFAGGRKIPRVIHITSSSRCNAKIIANNIETWRLKDHFFFLHDDNAVQTLLDQDWPEFPLLKHVTKCFPKGMGATWIDLWRLLVLWKYGGIYADLDTSPVPEFFNESTITAEDDAFFVVEVLGSPSQWFMSASPRHPMIFFSIFRLIMNVLKEKDLGNFQVVFTTGPGAVAAGFADFMQSGSYMWEAPAGHYVGVRNRTVTLVGNKENQNMYITRVIKPLTSNYAKHKIYQKTNMSHLTETQGTIYKPVKGVDQSCLSLLHSLEESRFDSLIKSMEVGVDQF